MLSSQVLERSPFCLTDPQHGTCWNGSHQRPAVSVLALRPMKLSYFANTSQKCLVYATKDCLHVKWSSPLLIEFTQSSARSEIVRKRPHVSTDETRADAMESMNLIRQKMESYANGAKCCLHYSHNFRIDIKSRSMREETLIQEGQFRLDCAIRQVCNSGTNCCQSIQQYRQFDSAGWKCEGRVASVFFPRQIFHRL